MKILVVGGASYDEIVQLDEFFMPSPATIFAKSSYQTPGSTGVGKALALAKLGHDVTFIAKVGKDSSGKNLIDTLQDANIDFHPIWVGKTEKHLNLMNSKGERISIFTQMSSTPAIDFDSYNDLIAVSDIVCLNIIDWCRGLIPNIKALSKPIYVDLHDYDFKNPYHQDFIDAADGVFLSSERLSDFNDFVLKMISQGKIWVVITHGAKGATAATTLDNLTSIPAGTPNIIDTNGAGDNFFAGFIHAYSTGNNLLNCLLAGRIAADACIASKAIVGEELSKEYLEKKLGKLKKNS